MILKLISQSTVTPLSLDEVKMHLRLSTASTVEDPLLIALVKSAAAVGENMCMRPFTPHTYQLSLDSFPAEGITLPWGSPLSTDAGDVVITYVDSSGAAQTLSSTAFTIDDQSQPAFLTPSSDNDWPETEDQINAVTVRYVAGYPISGGDPTTPEAIKSWMKLQVGSLYEHREAAVIAIGSGSVQAMPFVDGLLDPYRLLEVL
jgi:uncharacterized phiE125 gp8 family phage protein